MLYNKLRIIIDDSEKCIRLRKYMEIHICKNCKWSCVFKNGSGSFKFLIGCFIENHSEETANDIFDKMIEE